MTESQQGTRVGPSICMVAIALALCGIGRSTAQSPESSPREQLQQYVNQLQANSSDDALRTKIIHLALTLNPKPAVPDGAYVAAAKAKTIFASASSPDDMKAAAAAFAQAAQSAPWIPEYYYNEGLALEKAKQYDDAIHALNFYLLASPNAADAAEVRGKIEGIKYEKDKAAQNLALETARQQEAAQAEAARVVGKWGREGDSYYAFEVSGTPGSYSVTLNPTEARGVVYPGGPGKTMRKRGLERVSIAGGHVTFRETIRDTMMWSDGFTHNLQGNDDYDLSVSDDGKVLSGQLTSCNEGNCSAPKQVQLYRRD